VSRGQVLTVLTEMLSLLGEGPTVYNTHSFRIGKATDLVLQGYSTSQILTIGRWKSVKAFERYIKPGKISTT